VIAAGGTAGHVVPAIAVADALRAEGAEVSFVGGERAEAELVPAAGYPLDRIAAEGISRRNPLKAARALAKAVKALGTARSILRRRRPDAVLGGGGYVAGPAGLAASRLGLPLVLTEADSHLGLANRLLARSARRVCLAFPIAGREGPRYLVTGRPVPKAVLEADRGRARERFGISGEDRCLLVMGGSQGARSINRAAVAAFADPAAPRDFHVLHLAGRRDYAEVRAEVEDRGGAGGYTLLEFEPGLGDVLAASDLVLARSGGSIFEVAAAGRPAILVPYPHATADHQRDNAVWMERAGAATVLPDDELEPDRLRSLVAELFASPRQLDEMAGASRGLARPDAAARIADEILAAAS
jgi:UDP-N-acetylglucosamine--N-acetylmuramyl-(pentapeptide) pyrophosphoryl-undecaprenol N-acetylglucosamine transferase